MRPEDLARAVKELVEWAHEHAPAPEPEVRRRLRDHFGAEPVDFPVVSRGLESWDRPNVQVALDRWTAGKDVALVGLPVMQGYRAGIAELVRRPTNPMDRCASPSATSPPPSRNCDRAARR